MSAQARLHQLAINPVISAELSLSFSTLEALHRAVTTLNQALRDIPRPALFLTARAFAH